MRKTPLTKSPGEGSGRKLFAGDEALTDYLGGDEFLDRGERICRWVVRGTKIDWEALFNDAYLKARKSPSLLKVEDKEGFYKVFCVLALNLRNDRFRKSRRRGLFVELPRSELNKADPSINLDDELFRKEFLEAIASIRDERRRKALELRTQGYTFREIAEKVGCCHVTVRIWWKEAAEAFLDGREL